MRKIDGLENKTGKEKGEKPWFPHPDNLNTRSGLANLFLF